MYQATAAEFIPLPTIETRLAAKMKRSGRMPKLARIPSTVAEFSCGIQHEASSWGAVTFQITQSPNLAITRFTPWLRGGLRPKK